MLALLFTEIIESKEPINEYIDKAKELWKDIINSPDFNDKEKLIKQLHLKQATFERECGGNPLGKIIFPFVGIGQHHDYYISFDKINDGGVTDMQIVSKIIDAFKSSACSAEVKFTVEQLEAIYKL